MLMFAKIVDFEEPTIIYISILDIVFECLSVIIKENLTYLHAKQIIVDQSIRPGDPECKGTWERDQSTPSFCR